MWRLYFSKVKQKELLIFFYNFVIIILGDCILFLFLVYNNGFEIFFNVFLKKNTFAIIYGGKKIFFHRFSFFKKKNSTGSLNWHS